MNLCDQCRLYKECFGPVPPSGPSTAELVIVGEAPGKTENDTGRVFDGDTGHLLNFMLRSCSLDRDLIYITNAILCYPNKTKLTNKHSDYCKARLEDELSKLKKKKLIIAFGNFACQSLIGRSEIVSINGYFWEYNGTPVLTMLHPSHTLRDLFELDLQIKHLRKAKRYLDEHSTT